MSWAFIVLITHNAARRASSHRGEDVPPRTARTTAKPLRTLAPTQSRIQVGATTLIMWRAGTRWLAMAYETAVGKPAPPKKLPKVTMIMSRANSPLPVTPNNRADAGPDNRSIPCENILAAREPSDGLARMAHRIPKPRAKASASPDSCVPLRRGA